MFKAKLIEDKSYYKLRSRQLIYILIPAFAIGLSVNFYHIPLWASALGGVIYIAMVLIMSRTRKLMSALLGNKIIEIENNQIRIKSKNGSDLETIDLDNVEKVILKKEYGLSQETLKEISLEARGKRKENFIIIEQANKQQQYDFEFDSYYMISQLEKAIEGWTKRGYKIERV